MNKLTIIDIVEYMDNPEAYPNITHSDECFNINQGKKNGVYKGYIKKLKADNNMSDLSNVNWR